MGKIITFRPKKAASTVSPEGPAAGKHPKEIVVFDGVTLHDLWVRWTGHEPEPIETTPTIPKAHR